MSEQHIGRFEIVAEIGRGGMAMVYLARDPKVNRQVALKVLPRAQTTDSTSRERFQREAEVIAALEHPCIVPMYEFGEVDEQPFIVMRYMSGGSLVGKLRGGPLPLDQVEKVVDRVSMALDEAHSRQIVHRDLKPGNILFDQRGDAYLSDFGIVKMEEGSAPLTGSGILGTPAYMSPEQAQGGKDIDGRSDVYALGLILFEMLAGKPPFSADTPVQLVLRHILEPMPGIAETRPDLPAGVQTVLDFALAKDRTSRYQTAGLLSRDLRTVLAGGQIEDPPTLPLAAEAEPVDDGAPRTVTLAPIEGDGEPLTSVEPALVVDPAAPKPSTGSTNWVMGLGALTVIGLVGLACLAILVVVLITSNAHRTGRIAFVSRRDGNAQIYVMDADGSHVTRLTNDTAGDDQPAWSPDGSKIAFVSRRDGNAEVYVMSADGSHQVRLTNSPSDDVQPAWSPDGTKIAFSSTRDDPNAPSCQISCNQGIYLMAADGTGVTRLQNHLASSFGPAWSPDGKLIAFSVVDGSDHEIYSMAVDGSDVTRLTNSFADAIYNLSPAWSPDGKMIAFASNRDNPAAGFSLYLMSADGSSVTRLTHDTTPSISLSWSPDGKQIVFDSNRDDPNPASCGATCNLDIYLVSADPSASGASVTRLTTTAGQDMSVAWGP